MSERRSVEHKREQDPSQKHIFLPQSIARRNHLAGESPIADKFQAKAEATLSECLSGDKPLLRGASGTVTSALAGQTLGTIQNKSCCFPRGECVTIPVRNQNNDPMKQKTDVLQGTLALMVLKRLDVLLPLHGYGVARRIEQISGDLLAVNRGHAVSGPTET
jgi:hypothetical protein